MGIPAGKVIAKRHLLYSLKGDNTRRSLIVCIHEPLLAQKEAVDFNVSGRTSGCVISFEGLDEKETTAYGADEVQAIELAVEAMESYLQRLSRKYEFYFDDGEPYFEE